MAVVSILPLAEFGPNDHRNTQPSLEYFEYTKKKSEFDISDTEDDFNLDAFLNSNLTDLVKKTVEPVMADFIAKGTPEAVSSIHSKNVITFYYF